MIIMGLTSIALYKIRKRVIDWEFDPKFDLKFLLAIY